MTRKIEGEKKYIIDVLRRWKINGANFEEMLDKFNNNKNQCLELYGYYIDEHGNCNEKRLRDEIEPWRDEFDDEIINALCSKGGRNCLRIIIKKYLQCEELGIDFEECIKEV